MINEIICVVLEDLMYFHINLQFALHFRTHYLKTFQTDLKKMELTWGMAEREAKERRSWRYRSSCIILNG